MQGRVIAIANQKGGVGKTTTAVNLSACMAAAGRRVLLIDIDPQGNATSGLGIDKNACSKTVYEVLLGTLSIRDAIAETGVDRLHLIPANKNLVGALVELVDMEGREYRLRSALQSVLEEYDSVYIDCPPALNLLTINALAAADGVLVTLQCEYYALEGLSELLNTIQLVHDTLNPQLELNGVVFTMYQHTNLANQVMDNVRAYLGDKVYDTVIPRNVTLAEAPSFGQPVIYYDLKSSGAKAYLALTREVVARG